MASPPDPITTVNGRRCTRVLRSSTLLSDNTATSPATSTAAAPGTQTTVAAPLSSTEAALPAPTQPSSVSPSSFAAVATTATGPVDFTRSSAASSASSAALDTLPPSTLPTSLEQAGSSDISTPVVSVISSSTVAVLQPTAASQSSIPSIIGGNQGSSTSGGDGSSNGDTNNGGSMTPGAVAGIAIGIVVGIIGIVALILFCMRRRNIKRDKRLNEKSQGGEGGLAASQTRPLSVVAAKWAAFTAGVASKTGLRPSADGLGRRAPESPAFEPLTRPSYSTEGSTRQMRSASAPIKPPPSRIAAFKQKFKPQHDIIVERRSRAMSTDTIPSFYSPTPPQLAQLGDLSESLNPFRDSKPLHYRITNPDAPTMSPGLPTPKSQREPLTPGSARWREPTPEFAFPAGATSTNPFADPPNRSTTSSIPDARRGSLSMPPIAHVRTQSSTTNPASVTRASRVRSSWYSVDSGYNSPHHASALIPPLRPTKNPFHDRYAAEIDPAQQKEANSASIYVPPSKQPNLKSEKGPGSIPLPSRATLTVAAAMEREPLPTTSTTRSSWLLPHGSPASSYNARPGISRNSSKDSRRRTTTSRSTRGKSDPFDLDRPEVLAVASNYDPDEALANPRYSNGSDWWRGIIDEGAGSASTVGVTR